MREAVAIGADLVLFSGDKLFGGPQAGLIVGTSDAVLRAARHPIARAVRLDGSRIAALADVVDRYLAADVSSIPFWPQLASTTRPFSKRRITFSKVIPL